MRLKDRKVWGWSTGFLGEKRGFGGFEARGLEKRGLRKMRFEEVEVQKNWWRYLPCSVGVVISIRTWLAVAGSWLGVA